MLQKKDIIERKFNRTFRGYDPVEVKYFLEMLADEFEKLFDRLNELEPVIKEFEEGKGRTPHDIIRDAESRAENIIEDAEKLAADVLDKAKRAKAREEEKILHLKHERDKLSQLLENIIEKQRQFLKLLRDETETPWSDEKRESSKEEE